MWTVAALLAGHVATRRTGRRVRRSARIAVGFAVAGLLFVIIRVIAVAVLASFGWIFVADRKLITLALILIPAVAVPVAAFRLLRLVRRVDRDAPVPAELRAAAAPGIVLPFQLTAFGALAGFFEWFLPPPGRAMKAALLSAILIVIGVLLLLRVWGRSARLGAPDARLRASGRVWLLRLGVTVVVLAVITGLATLDMRASRFPDTFSMMAGAPISWC